MPIPSNITLTDIANMALSVIGHTEVRNVESDNNTWAKKIRSIIYAIIKEEQNDFYWPELKTEIRLERSEEQPDDASYVQYNLPGDVIQLIRLIDNTPFVRKDDKLRVTCNYTVNPTLEYIRYSENPSEWSTSLIECIYTKLAVQLAMPLTQNANVAQLAQGRYKEAQAGRSRAFKSGTSPIRRRQSTGWNQTRINGTRFSSWPYDGRNNLRP